MTSETKEGLLPDELAEIKARVGDYSDKGAIQALIDRRDLCRHIGALSGGGGRSEPDGFDAVRERSRYYMPDARADIGCLLMEIGRLSAALTGLREAADKAAKQIWDRINLIVEWQGIANIIKSELRGASVPESSVVAALLERVRRMVDNYNALHDKTATGSFRARETALKVEAANEILTELERIVASEPASTPDTRELRSTEGETLAEFMLRVERAHFRTEYDTGANSNALFIWNMVRRFAGLTRLDIQDLSKTPTAPAAERESEK